MMHRTCLCLVWPSLLTPPISLQSAESGHIVRYYNMHPGSGEGMHAPLNLAAKVLAPSDWIAYLNDSAVWKPDHLKTLVSAGCRTRNV